MNYPEIIKNALNDEERRRGLRRQVVVDSKALRMLLEDHERMDTYCRTMAEDMHIELKHKLHNVLHALYCENHDSERLMLLIMHILKPMIEDRIKTRQVDAIFNR